MQNTSCNMLAWMRHKLESRLPGEISITSDRQITRKVKNSCILAGKSHGQRSLMGYKKPDMTVRLSTHTHAKYNILDM